MIPCAGRSVSVNSAVASPAAEPTGIRTRLKVRVHGPARGELRSTSFTSVAARRTAVDRILPSLSHDPPGLLSGQDI